MKKLALLSLIVFCLAACKKEEKVSPDAVKTPSTLPIAATTTVKPDTIPDRATMRLQLVKDSVNKDEIMFQFIHTASLNYTGDDAAYFKGYGAESLASISQDGRDLAINVLPYKSGTVIGLDVDVKASGTFFFKLSYVNNIPPSIKIWVKDTFLKDSVNVRKANYTFKVDKADANTFGNKRFQLILRDTVQQKTITLH